MSKIEDWLKTALPITAKMTHGFETDISLRKKLHEQLDQLKDENKKLKQKLEKIKEVINCDEYNKEHCIYCAEALHCYTKQVFKIIESEN